eukprot:11759900-Alexandrium_andersonii.AAC.1
MRCCPGVVLTIGCVAVQSAAARFLQLQHSRSRLQRWQHWLQRRLACFGVCVCGANCGKAGMFCEGSKPGFGVRCIARPVAQVV